MSSVNGISFGGLASGIDSDSIIRQLLALERRPLLALEQRKKGFNKQKNLLGDLEGKLDKLFDAAKAIRKTTSFLDFKVTTDNEEKYLSATASSSALQASYDIGVTQLATQQVSQSSGSADKDQATHGTGLLTVTIDGTTTFINIAAPSTLDNMASAINNAGIGVSANVVDTQQGANPFKLVITSKETGTDANFTLGTDSADATLDAFVAGITTTAGKNAKIELNSVEIERQSNTFSDVIQGVTLTLKGEHASETTRVTVTPDSEETGKKVKAFVDAYNDIIDFVNNQKKVTKSSETGADGQEDEVKTNPLFGDSALSTIRSGLRSIMGGSVSTGNTKYALLAQVGIESATDGKLTFSQSEFDEALADDEQAVLNLFADSTNGIAQRVYDRVDDYTDSVDGILQARTSGIDRSIADIDRQISRAEDRIERREILLTQQYANLETVMNRLNSQMSAILSLR